jgi:hypothetical protein
MGVFSGLGGMLGGFAKKAGAKRAMRRAAEDKRKATAELKALENSRQAVINPYQNTKDISSLAKDLSGKLSNPYANLGVSTAAAEIQMEQSDLALANTLDSLMASGASAGGATALAQAALQSKKGIAASIETQEAQNEKMRAGGEQRLQQLTMQEGQRVQGVQIQEGRRTQAADAQGKAFMFNASERRETDKINYVRGEKDMAKRRELGAAQAKSNAIAGIWQSAGEMMDAPAEDFMSALGGASGGGGGGGSMGGMVMGMLSDRRTKKNIKLIGKSASGLKIYAFEYINKIFGEGVWQGVMSDEIPQIAVIKHSDGYDRVDYSKLDVEFKQI